MGQAKQDILFSNKTDNIFIDSVTSTTPAGLKTEIINWLSINPNKRVVGQFTIFEALLGTTTSYTWTVLYSNFLIE